MSDQPDRRPGPTVKWPNFQPARVVHSWTGLDIVRALPPLGGTGDSTRNAYADLGT
jgi:hypothetical protein